MQHPLPFSYSSPPSSPPPPSNVAAVNGRGRWGPYSSSKSFDVNMATILIILVVASVLAFALHSAFTFLLRLYRLHYRRRRRPHRHVPPSGSVHGKQPRDTSTSSLADAIPTVVFSRGTKLAGLADDAAECAICLGEFVDGERIRVMPACSHGFHVGCVERWLASKPSCPTCRTSCLPAAAAPPPPAAEP